MNGTRTCSVTDCARALDSHGLCGMHATRRRRGKPLDAERMTRPEYFMRHIDKDAPGGCWIWTAKIARNGYGVFSGDHLLAHRFAYLYWVGEINEGMQIDHLCMVKACVNPAHLEAVTPWENMRRKDLAYGTGSARTECPQGHPYDERNTYLHPTGRRCCRACARERARRNRRSKK